MASELYISSSAAVTPYAVVRRKSDGRVANVAASAFVAFADADVADYATPLAAKGGDLWTANFPAWAEPGEYLVLYYDRAGPAPAVDDAKLKEAGLYWSGAAATPGGGAEPTPAEMVTLIKQALRDNPVGVVSVNVDGEVTQFERAQALAELKYWEQRAARAAGRRRLFNRFDLSRA